MKRKLLVIAAAVVMPVGIVAVTAGSASAVTTTDSTGAPATASCTLSGGVFNLKYPIGIVTSGGYQAPTKNKGNQIKISGIALSCTSSAVSARFTGSASGKIKTSTRGESAATFYSCASLSGVNPPAGGTLSGSLKVKWSTPAGQKFSGGKKTTIAITSVLGAMNGAGDGTFTIPGIPDSGSITGSFPGSDGGATGSSTDSTQEPETSLIGSCTSTAGLGTINLGSGSATLQ